SFANVPSGLPVPNHISEIRGRVIKCRDANSRIMRGGEKRVAGTQAGSHNPQPIIALLLKPVQATTDVNYTLAGSIQRSSDIRRNRVIGAADFRGHTN